jgi:E3 ubiquitin-protein ligase TRIP12
VRITSSHRATPRAASAAQLSPKITVVRKDLPDGHNADQTLPSCSTCHNYLKLPAYSCAAVLAARIDTAITDGQGHFALS